jgi:hypothetical protein
LSAYIEVLDADITSAQVSASSALRNQPGSSAFEAGFAAETVRWIQVEIAAGFLRKTTRALHIATFKDITDRKKLKRACYAPKKEEANRSINQIFLANMTISRTPDERDHRYVPSGAENRHDPRQRVAISAKFAVWPKPTVLINDILTNAGSRRASWTSNTWTSSCSKV